MNFKFKHTEKIAGIFVLTAMIILVSGAVMVAISKKVFVKKYIFYTTISDASGLSTSTALNFKGYEIGKVESFEFNKDNEIDVKLAVYKKYLGKILKGCAIYRQSNPITGETSLVLLTPKFHSVTRPEDGSLPIGAQLPVGEKIHSLDMPNGRQLLEDGTIEKSGDSVSLIFDEARDFFTHLRGEFKLKKDSFRTFFEELGDFSEALARNKGIFDHLQKLLNPDQGPIFKTMEQFTEITARLNSTVEKVETMMENYKNPDGLMLKMMSLDKKQLQQTVQNINNNLTALHEMLASIKNQSPMIAELMEKTRKTLEAVNNNPLLRGGISDDKGSSNSTRKKRMDIDQ